MRKRILLKDIIIVGFAMFSIFFGAGNLIFPPYLGAVASANYVDAIAGFVLTSVGLTFIGIITSAKTGSTVEGFAHKVGYKFSKILEFLIILCIGPMLALPRTGATTFEVGVKTLVPSIPSIVGVGVFFLITCVLCLKESKVIDRIGTFLTPVLLVFMALMIVRGMIVPTAAIETAQDVNMFTESLTIGYQTMDAMVTVLITGLIYKSLQSKGYRGKETIKMIFYCGLIAVTLLITVYGGLVYLGATSGLDYKVLDRTRLLVIMTRNIWGVPGAWILGIVISFACLTTSIGLTTMTAEYFHQLFKGKLSYSLIVVITSILVTLIAIMGVDEIVKISAPILEVIYPVVIVIMFCNLFDFMIPNDYFYKAAAYTALILSFLQVTFSKYIYFLPLVKYKLAWVMPSLIVAILVSVAMRNRKERTK